MNRKMILLAAGLALAGGRAVGQNIQTEALRVWMDDITVTADGQTATRLTVYENDPERDYTAFNMSLVVPDGITVAQVKKGRNWVNSIELSVRAAETHTISCNMPEGTLIKIMCSSTQNDDLYPDDEDGNLVDELFTIDLLADPQMTNGTYTVLTEGVVFAHNQNNVVTGYVPNPLPSFHLTVTGGQDGLTIPYTLSSAGVGTLVLPFDAEVPSGLSVWTATEVAGNEIQLSHQTSIVAGTPLIVTGEPASYSFTGVPSVAGTEFMEGVLIGTTEQKVITEGYVLQRQNGVTGFYRVDPAKPITVPAYRCWLDYDGTAYVLPFRFDFDAVRGVADGAKDDLWFDLSGRPTSDRTRGVRIQRDRKVVKK